VWLAIVDTAGPCLSVGLSAGNCIRFIDAGLIDKRFLNNTFDTQSVLIQLASGLSTANQVAQFADVIRTSLEDAIPTGGVRVLLLDTSGGVSSSSADLEPLDGKSKLASMLLDEKAVFESPVDLDRTRAQLSESDKYWLIDNNVGLLVPIGEVGLVVVGQKLKSNFFTAQEKALVELVAKSVEARARGFVGRSSDQSPQSSQCTKALTVTAEH